MASTPSGPEPPVKGGPPASIPILSAFGLGKSFPGVKALDGVDLEIRAGEIHALCGENGAGKSTLIKILGGVLPHGSYQGTIRMRERECRFRSPRDALAAGINIIYQELALAVDLTVAENVFLGREPARAGFLDRERMEAEAAHRLALLGQSDIRPDCPVRELSVGGRQMVEIARALPSMTVNIEVTREHSSDMEKAGSPGGILILDEPTSALSLRESRVLLDVIARLKDRGLGILYISHKLDEVLAVSDRISVLRNGRSVGTLDRSGADAGTLISMMVGRKLEEVFPTRSSAPPASHVPLLRVRDWTVPSPANPRVDLVSGVSFDLAKGEILGLAGLMGAGRTELMESLFGLGALPGRGRVEIEGKPYLPASPGRAVARGLALVPEDRRRHGFVSAQSILENITGACLERFCRFGQFIDGDA
ncbi:MAG: sugar ABC transporter ATP-binding protein, partial [Fibrobacteria bacterium]